MANGASPTIDFESLLQNEPEPIATFDEQPKIDFNALLVEPDVVQSRAITASYVDPNSEAERVILSRKLKEQFDEDWSPMAVEPAEARRRLGIADNERILAENPILSNRFTDPTFANITHKDLNNLGSLERTVTGTMADIGVTAVKGAVAVPQALVGIANIPTFGYAGKAVEAIGIDFAEVQDMLDEMYSPAQQAANQRVQAAEGLVDTLSVALQNPSTILTAVGESLPSMFAGGLIGRGLMAVGARTVGAGMAGPALPGLLSRTLGERTAGVVAGAAGEGLITAGTMAEQVRAGTEEGLLSGKQVLASLGAGIGTGLLGVAGGKAAQKLKLTDIDTLIAEGGEQATRAAAAKTGFLKNIVGSGISEGAFEELPQSAQEQMWQNWATDRPIMEGVGNAAAMGLLSGAVMGSGGGAWGSLRQKVEQAQQARDTAGRLSAITELVRASQVIAADPQTFRDYMADLGDNSGIRELFVDGRILAQRITESGVPIQQLEAAMPGLTDQIATAAALNESVTIPLADFATHIALTPLADTLVPDLRTEGGMSVNEAQTVINNAADEFKGVLGTVMTEAKQDAAFRKSFRAVRDSLEGQIAAASPIYSRQDARAAATLEAARYAALGRQLGISPEEAMQRFPAAITGEGMMDQQGPLLNQPWDMRQDELPVPPVIRDLGGDLFKPHTLEDRKAGAPIRFKNPIRLSDGTRLSGFTKYDQAVFYGYDKNGEAFTWRREFVDPALIESSRDSNQTAEQVRQGLQQLTDAGQLSTQSAELQNALRQNAPIETIQGTPLEPSDDVAAIEQNAIPESVDEGATLENALQLAKSKIWQKGRDLKVAMQQAVQSLAQEAGVDVGTPSPQTTDYLTRVGVKDALLALNQNANAIGWYDLKTRQALAVMSLVHPEIATDPQSRLAFVWAMAVTSNGLKVDKNFELAERVYSEWKASAKKVTDRRMPTNVGIGTAKNAINDALGLFNTLHDAWGLDNLNKFMQTDFTVGEITALSKDLTPGGEHADVTVRGAAILGPKIGNGFFSNLYGNFNALTMDRWLIRTWGRWSGTLIRPMPVQTGKARDRLSASLQQIVADETERARLSQAIGKEITGDMPVDELAIAVQEASVDPQIRQVLNESDVGLELRKAGNSLAKYLDGQKEAPAGPLERKYIREVFGRILDELRQDPRYTDLTMADLQAVLWYAEKRLYETAKQDITEDDAVEGYADEEAPDYANAAAAVARKTGVSDRRIANALKREENYGRTRDARSADAAEGRAGTEQQRQAAGFTRQEKRFFTGSRAILRVRSNRNGDGQPSGSYQRKGLKDGKPSGLLKALGVRYVAEWKLGKSPSYIFKANDLANPSFIELESNNLENAKRFADAITVSKKAAGAIGAAVYVYPADEYTGMRLFLTKEGDAGFALKPDGDIVSVFSKPGTGAGRAVLELAVSAGGKKLDAFDTILPEFYSAHGFVAVSRLTWDESQAPADWSKEEFSAFNDGQPDVVFMVYDPSFTGGYSILDGKRFEGENAYGDAIANQEKAVRRVERQQRQAERARQMQAQQAEQPPQTLAQRGLRISPEAAQWVEGTEVVNESGQPAVMYTGTAADITEFEPGQAGAIYLSPSVAFASGFAESAARRDEEGAANVLPVIVRATNVFDPANPEHREGLRAWLIERVGENGTVTIEAPKVPPMKLTPAQLAERIASGNWMYVESPIVQEYVRQAGHDGFWTTERKVRNLGVFSSNQIKSVFNQAPTAAPGILEQAADDTRGYYDPQRMIAVLTSNADFSTLHHEMFHHTFNVYAQLAQDPNGPAQIKEDFLAMLNNFGVPDLAAWNAMPFEEQRRVWEGTAYQHEVYLSEGKAPSEELKSVFDRISKWIRDFYRDVVARLNLQYREEFGEDLPALNAETRAIFDRMFASEAEISRAEQTDQMQAMFREKPEGMDDATWDAYRAMAQEPTDRAVSDLQRTMIREMLRLSRMEIRKTIQKEVRDELLQTPAQGAIWFLRRGQRFVDGELQTVEGPHRLSTEILKAMYPEGSDVDWRKLHFMFAQDGLPPADVASMFGFENADQMVRILLATPKLSEAVEARTDERMEKEYGELNTPEAIEQKVEEAVHNELRARLITTEYRYLSRAPESVRNLMEAVRRAAAEMVGRKKVADLRPREHINAEIKASQRAVTAMQEGNEQEQAKAKRDQMLQNRMAAETLAAREEVDKILRRFRRLQSAGSQKNMRGEARVQLNELLSRFDLRVSRSMRDIAENPIPIRDYIQAEASRLSAFVPEIPDWIADSNVRLSYKELTVEQLRELNQFVSYFENLARREQKQYQAVRNQTYKQEVDLILAELLVTNPKAFDADGKPVRYEKFSMPLRKELAGKFGSEFDSQFVNMENILDVLTGGKGKAIFESLFGRLSAAQDARSAFMKRLGNAINKATSAYSVKERLEMTLVKELVPGTPYYLTRENRIAIALFYGSETGRQRLMDGNRMTEAQIQAVLATLDAKDVELIKTIYRISDEIIWPELKAVNERTAGIAPEKVKPLAYLTPHGQIDGGYVPLVYDGEMSARAHDLQTNESVQELLGGTQNVAATQRSASKQRLETVNRDLSLSLRAIAYKLNETVHDITHREAVADTYRLLQNTEVQNALRFIGGPAVYNTFLERVREVAVKPRTPSGFTEKTFWYLRKNTMINMMGASVNTILLNVLGVFPAVRRVGGYRFLRAMGQLIGERTKLSRDRYEWILEKSPYMRERTQNFDRDLNAELSRLDPSSVLPGMDFWFAGLSVMDRMITMPTWMAAYEKGMEVHANDEKAAVDYADRVVRQTAGGGRAIDLAKVAGGVGIGGELKKAVTMYMNFFLAQLGMLRRGGAIAGREWSQGKKARAAALVTLDVMLIVVLPAALEAIARGNCGEDPEAEDYLYCSARASALFVGNFFPIFRDVLPYAWKQFDPDVQNFGVRFTPLQSAAETLGRLPKATVDILTGESDETDLKDFIRGMGYAFGLPGFQAWRTIDGAQAFMDGETDNPAVILTGPPK